MISTFGVLRGARDRVLHDRPVVDAEIGEPPGEHRDAGRRAAGQRVHRAADLLRREDRRHVDLDAFRDSARTASNSGSPRVVVTGSLT